jgi:hypothetical protein
LSSIGKIKKSFIFQHTFAPELLILLRAQYETFDTGHMITHGTGNPVESIDILRVAVPAEIEHDTKGFAGLEQFTLLIAVARFLCP